MSLPALGAAHSHPRLVAYLRRATWSVPTDRRAEVWEELEDHVLTRARQLEVLGLAPEGALQQALTELGAPSRVGLGMGRVFHGPKVLVLGAALLLGIVVQAVLPRPSAPVVVLTYPRMMAEMSAQPRLLCLPPAPRALVPWRGCFPTVGSAVRPLQVNLRGVQSALSRQGLPAALDAKGRLRTRLNHRTLSFPAWAFTQGTPYGSAADLALALLQGDPSLVLTSSGGTPGVRSEEVALQFGQGGWTPEAGHYYAALAPALLKRLWPAERPRTVNPEDPSRSSSTWRTGLREGEVVMLVLPVEGPLYRTDFALVGVGGEVSLGVPRAIRFVSRPGDLTAPAPDQAALLVRVTGVPLTDLPGAVLEPRALR